MSNVTPETSGIAGAMVQTCFNLGITLGLSIQAGLFTIHPGRVENFQNLQTSFWFVAGWGIVNMLAILLFYRNVKKPDGIGDAQGEALAPAA